MKSNRRGQPCGEEVSGDPHPRQVVCKGYSKPELTSYGRLVDLTRAGGNRDIDATFASGQIT